MRPMQDWAAATISPAMAEEVDRSNTFPTGVDMWKEMGAFGLLGASSGLLPLCFQCLIAEQGLGTAAQPPFVSRR